MDTGIFRGTRMHDHWFENSQRAAEPLDGSDHPSSNEKPSIHERSISVSSVSTARERDRGRHPADPLTNTEANQCTQTGERDVSRQEPRQPGRRKARMPHPGSPELWNSEWAREAEFSDGKEDWPRHKARTVSKSKAGPHRARTARLNTRDNKKPREQVMVKDEADQSRMPPGDGSKRTAPNSSERGSPNSHDAMPPPPLPVMRPAIVQKDMTNRVYPAVGNVRRPHSEEELLVRACDRAGCGQGRTDAEPVVADEGGTSEHSQSREIRTGGVILPLQSISWIDPSSRPTTPSLTYNTQASGVSTRPISCAATLTNALEDDGPVTGPTAPRQAEESIAEFIMRIESEAEAGIPELRPHGAGLFENEDCVGLGKAEGQQIYYETLAMQTPNALAQESWNPNIPLAQEPEVYIGSVADPYTNHWEYGPEEQDLSFAWDPYQYRRY